MPNLKAGQSKPYWETKSLSEMNEAEWEGLCDNCGQCCLHKIEETTTNLYYCTNIACKLLDLTTGRCKDYANRKQIVPDCVHLTPKIAEEIGWLPNSCAYRLLADGKKLEPWHPLISGDTESVVKAGISIKGRAVSETIYPNADIALEIWMKEGHEPIWVQPMARGKLKSKKKT